MFQRLCEKLKWLRDVSYHRLEIRVEQHVSVGVDGKVVTVRSKLQEKGEKERQQWNDRKEPMKSTDRQVSAVCALTVNRGVSLLMSSSETSIAITPRMSWFCDFWEDTPWGKRKKESQCKTHVGVLLFFLYESSPSAHSEQFQGNVNRTLVSLIPRSPRSSRDSLTRPLQPCFQP